jgi:hypothetical protein
MLLLISLKVFLYEKLAVKEHKWMMAFGANSESISRSSGIHVYFIIVFVSVLCFSVYNTPVVSVAICKGKSRDRE